MIRLGRRLSRWLAFAVPRRVLGCDVTRRCFLPLVFVVPFATVLGSEDLSVQALRLVPFPKRAQLLPERMALGARLSVAVSNAPRARQAVADLKEDLARVTGKEPELSTLPLGPDPPQYALTLSPGRVPIERVREVLPAAPASPEGYTLAVAREFAAVGAGSEEGLAHGIQTLRQLVRANAADGSIPGVRISDWPSLRYRGYSDDITRGPSPKLQTLRHEVRTAAMLKMNFFSYYLEHQYAFKKHPIIGPKNGSLTPEELKALVEYAKGCNVEVFGNQQSFGHFGHILKHEAYKPLRETADILNPTTEATYRLLDDLYSEQAPLLESEFFNVCCDETDGLGTGPSKPTAEKIGVGGVYTMHIRRIHDLLKDKYGKRMMMWGDIILRHPDHLPKIPKDTVMLSWGYHAAPSFDDAITPFSQSGYEFFVCPGVSCWSRILPDFGVAVANIRTYVRDGAKHGALGMWNTTWDDDGENFFAPNWHGVAWGAECAWNASTTPIEDFNRRIGGVLFGEPGDHFGRAIEMLSKTHRLPNYGGMFDSRFWNVDPDLGRLPVDEAMGLEQSRALMAVVDPALDHLRALKAQAKVDAEQIDYVIFGAERMRLMATRAIAFLSAARSYERAVLEAPGSSKAASYLAESEAAVHRVRDEHAGLKQQYIALWHRENKPYALDWVIGRFDALIGRYDKILSGLRRATEALGANQPLPAPREVGLDIVEMGVRRTRPARVWNRPLKEEVPWAEKSFTKRMGVSFDAGNVERHDQPVEVDLPLPATTSDAIRLFELDLRTGGQVARLGQLRTVDAHKRLAFVAAGRSSGQTKRLFWVYFDPASQGPAEWPAAVRLKDAPDGMTWIENDHLRLLVGPEGAHIYRWEVKALQGRDLTHPGQADWAGFADLYGEHRHSKNRIDVVWNGPVVVRLRCTDATGLTKTISVYAGVPWVEVVLNSGQGWFWCYDDVTLMGADAPTPGSFLFSDGHAGRVKRSSSTSECQEGRTGVHWGAKFVPGGPLLALITPEVASRHVVGPGGGMGGVGIEGSPPAAHFIIYGGPCPDSPKDALESLRAGLDYRNQPQIEVYAVQTRPSNP